MCNQDVNCNVSYRKLHEKLYHATPKILGKYLTWINCHGLMMSKAPKIVYNYIQTLTTQDEINPKLTFLSISQVKCGFNLLYNHFRSIT